MDELKQTIRGYVMREFMDEGDAFDVTTPLISSGIVDPSSIGSFKRFLERRFEITIADSEATPAAFDSVNRIAELVTRVRARTPAAG